VLAQWLVETARHAGYAVQATSIPGVAQRTGATTYYIEVYPVPLAQLGGRRPVFCLNPVPGALDALVSSELMETARQIGNGMASPGRTLVISSSARALTTLERMQMGDGRLDSERLLALTRTFSRAHHLFDMNAVARDNGTIVSAVLLGAIAGSALFPFGREAYEAVVRAGTGAAGPGGPSQATLASLRGFAKAFEIVAAPPTEAQLDSMECHSRLDRESRNPGISTAWKTWIPGQAGNDGASGRFHSEFAGNFPPQTHAMLALGHDRLLDYQGPSYGALYLQRMAQVLQAEREADVDAANDFATTREMARWLALWMAFDDIVRVADLKSRASRWQRVKDEVKAGDDDLLMVYDHFKPGVPEFAALLPGRLATWLLAWDHKRALQGKTPWALPLKVGSHSVLGMLALRTLASLKWLRQRGSRYAAEQAMIERWLCGVLAGTRRDWRLGHELALCGRLIKGYGATNERGKNNLLHVLDHLAHGADAAQAAQAVAAAREAALQDEGGQALDLLLLAQGAPPRPLKAQPIRWMRRPASSAMTK
jgi:indolepyruvate ferredoxin oxidoreductase beta subunit